MNKSAKPVILYSLAIFVIMAAFLLGTTGMKLKCDQLKKEIVKQEESVASKRSRQLFLTARLQYFTSEDRIVSIAGSELGMIKQDGPRIVLEVSKEKIDLINNELAKYE